MATVRDTIRYMLLNYPSLYKSPRQVMLNTIGRHSQHEWNHETGELDRIMYKGERNRKRMDYSDLDERTAELIKDLDETKARIDGTPGELDYFKSCMRRHNQRLMEIDHERMNRKFIAKNIETILDSDTTLDFKGSVGKPETYHACNMQYVPAFNFPDNVTKDWEKALTALFQHWLWQLNTEYGVPHSNSKKSESYEAFIARVWPQAAQDTYKAIREAQERILMVCYTPEERAQRVKNEKYMSKLIAEVLKEC